MSTDGIRRIAISALVALGLLVALTLWRSLPKKETTSNPATTMDLAALRKTDAKLLLPASVTLLKPSVSNLTALALFPDDRIVVGSREGILVMDDKGQCLSNFKTVEPVRCLAVAADGRIAIGFDNHVELRPTDGTLSLDLGFKSDAMLTSVAITSNTLYAADCANRVVWLRSLSGTRGGKLQSPARFVVPSPFFDVAVDKAGAVWIANPGMHRIEHYTADGRFVSSWGEASFEACGFCGCCNPSHFAITPDGGFVTCEKRIVRVKLYDGNGRFQGIISGQEDWPNDLVGLDVAVDSHGRILVLDPSKDNIRIYQLLK